MIKKVFFWFTNLNEERCIKWFAYNNQRFFLLFDTEGKFLIICLFENELYEVRHPVPDRGTSTRSVKNEWSECGVNLE